MAVLLYFLNRSQSSSAKSPLPAGEYEVFLNFRGSDVRYDFADSLHTYLKKYEIRTFFDEEELHKGEEIDSKLLDAIEGSKIYIPIISAKYASSRSPLMELAHMVKCCEKEKGHLILPIFYKVEVGDVKNQRGTFGESFRELAQKHDARTIREWKNALRTVTELKGWTVTPTTRTVDEEILKFFPKCESYKPDLMNDDIALQLFSRHAFGSDYPPTGYMDLSQDFVEVAAGLPLAIKAIGSVVFRKDKKFWVAKLKMFREIPDEQVQKRLKIVYEELSLDEKHIFLDIACYFIGEPTDRPSFLWDDSNLHPLVSIDTLCLKAFIKINERNELWMHDQYKLLGRDIVREEDIVNPWKRSRMWSNKDVLNMLRDKQGTEELKILRVYVEHRKSTVIKILEAYKYKNLSGLRYLEVRYGRLTGDFNGILPNLRWLRLDGCCPIPSDLNLKSLVVLEMHGCPVAERIGEAGVGLRLLSSLCFLPPFFTSVSW
ncbi:unnamed protein product [Linum tenue]|uniref:TIR domain-containing protein n=1 Tax=Linum tenue TaxID=586396 RepID=A0AAV0IBX1_9ROSI|nr:unnamed protein product [Linum tenue]